MGGSGTSEDQETQPQCQLQSSSPKTTTDELQTHHQPFQPPTSSKDEATNKVWGTHIMGPPAAPSVHPDNQKAATWSAADHQQMIYQQPYVLYSPVEKPSHNNPFEPVIHMFNSWSRKTETIARNIWHNLKTGPSVSEAAWGKVNLTAKAITEGGFESLFKQTFASDPNEKLNKTFACYLSTSTGPVAGTLYLSTSRVAFCSDRPLVFTAPSGQEAWSYYKVVIPLTKIDSVNPVIMSENPPEKYIEIVTIDGHDFWFMGFVNFEKASHHLLGSVSDFRSTQQQRAAVLASG
ncbi:GEM-like protein 5 [Quillaja saponaria]|uniref:GEM-like protein 5 n=1 Tax=Quillaja saponaria TaxID=32244 RepID=A0AAD7LG31_QUISA|nr:GEM-like protein 5 [Quillaja saponaria]